MKRTPGRCPMTRKQIVDSYFIEQRTRLLDMAAFLDRLDRAADEAQPDFREQAFRRALELLANAPGQRVLALQQLLSDPSETPLEALDQKSANGAYNPAGGQQ